MRRTHAVTALVGLMGGVLMVFAPAAVAQTGYPPGACTVLTGTQDVGAVNVGQTFKVQLAPTCAFTPGTAVTVTVNGVNVTGKVANANGFAVVTITATSASQLSVDDPTLAPAVCGTNTVTARGPSTVANGQIVTQTATFTLICPGPTTTGAATTGVGASGPAVPSTGRLSLTGANITRWLLAALALVAAGSVLVLADRRRHRGRNDGLAG